MGFSGNGVSAVLILYGLGAVIGNLLSGWMADRLGSFRTLLILACGQVLWMLPMSLLPLPVPLFLIALLVWSIGGWSFVAGQQARLVALAGRMTPVALALNAAAIYVGAAIGTAAGGVILQTSSLTTLGWAGSLCAIIPVLHILWSRRLSG